MFVLPSTYKISPPFNSRHIINTSSSLIIIAAYQWKLKGDIVGGDLGAGVEFLCLVMEPIHPTDGSEMKMKSKLPRCNWISFENVVLYLLFLVTM